MTDTFGGLGKAGQIFGKGANELQNDSTKNVANMDFSTESEELYKTMTQTTQASLALNLNLTTYKAATDMIQKIINEIKAKQ